MYDYDWLVIGSGPAGEKGAVQAAWFGRRVAVVERAPAHGGAWPGADRDSAVARGGSFFGPALHARSAERRAFCMDEPLDTLGFRPVRSVQE